MKVLTKENVTKVLNLLEEQEKVHSKVFHDAQEEALIQSACGMVQGLTSAMGIIRRAIDEKGVFNEDYLDCIKLVADNELYKANHREDASDSTRNFWRSEYAAMMTAYVLVKDFMTEEEEHPMTEEERNNHRLTEEEAEDLRSWMKEEAHSAMDAEDDHDDKGEKLEAYYCSGVSLVFTLVRSVTKENMLVGKMIARLTRDMEEEKRNMESTTNTFKKKMVEGKAATYQEIITHLMDYPYKG